MGTRSSPLNDDMLKAIMLLVVASAGGAVDLAKAMLVSKLFKDDKDLLKIANFENFLLPKSIDNCQHLNGLLVKCAEADNVSAQYVLAQVILLGFSQYLDRQPVFYLDENPLQQFLSYFMPQQAMTSSTTRFSHFQLVSLFLSRCSLFHNVSMLPHVESYVNHFGYRNKGSTKFYKYFTKMYNLLRAIVDVGQMRNALLISPMFNIGQTEVDMGSGPCVMFMQLMIERTHSYYVTNNAVHV